MHKLWTHGNGDQRFIEEVQTYKANCMRLMKKHIDTPQLAEYDLQRANHHENTLQGWQIRLSKALSEMERDWEYYKDRDELQEYYDFLQALYLAAGGHLAGVQERGAANEPR